MHFSKFEHFIVMIFIIVHTVNILSNPGIQQLQSQFLCLKQISIFLQNLPSLSIKNMKFLMLYSEILNPGIDPGIEKIIRD